MSAAAARHWNVLIVGAGSSGCVLARRLSALPDCRVALLEAGPAEAAGSALSAVRNGHQPAVVPGLNWKFRTAIKGDGDTRAASERTGGSIFDYEAGRLVGGSSAVNATQALRGAPADFDRWAETCGAEWSWEAVLPTFRDLEDDPLGPSPLHGRDGPLPLRREAVGDLRPLQLGLRMACIDAGFAVTEDLNDPGTTGVGVIPRNVVDGVRVSAADAWLAPALGRPNLTLLCGALVHRLLWDEARPGNGHCRGVLASFGDDPQAVELLADTVVLCAGVVGTPAVLLRSGVGDPQRLREGGQPVALALPGVGRHYMEHPVAGIWGVPVAGACERGEPLRQTLLRSSSGCPGQADDMHLCMMGGIDARQMFPHLASADSTPTVAGLTVCYNRSRSAGVVRLADANPRVPPLVFNNCLGDDHDVRPLCDGVELAWDLLHRPALKPLFARLLAWTDGIVRSRTALEQAVRAFVRPAAHACGTARMGPASDAAAVVDPCGRLHGAANVWVADASVMPEIPSAPPHLSCLMVAERIAARLAAALQNESRRAAV